MKYLTIHAGETKNQGLAVAIFFVAKEITFF